MRSSTRAGNQRNPAPKALRTMSVTVTIAVAVVATMIMIIVAVIVNTAILLIMITMQVKIAEEQTVVALDVAPSFSMVDNQDQLS